MEREGGGICLLYRTNCSDEGGMLSEGVVCVCVT